MCFIQTWIRLKKLYFHGKRQNYFTHRCFNSYIYIYIYLQKFIWNKNLICMILFSKKFPKQYKKQAKTKVRSEHSPIIWGLIFHLVVNSMRKKKKNRLWNVYDSLQICVRFIWLENLVYHDNSFIKIP